MYSVEEVKNLRGKLVVMQNILQRKIKEIEKDLEEVEELLKESNKKTDAEINTILQRIFGKEVIRNGDRQKPL